MDGGPPDPSSARTTDELVGQLRALRAWSGTGYRQLHRGVVELRKRRGVPDLPSYSTIHRCLQADRSRLDVELVVDIVHVLTADPAAAIEWRQACQAVAGAAAAAAVVKVSTALPRLTHPVCGRANEIASLTRWCAGPGALVALDGMPGVGKTATALQVAGAVAKQPDRLQVYVDLRGHDSSRPAADPAAVLDGVLRLLGLPGSAIYGLTLTERTAKLRELAAGRSGLLLLDNAADHDQVLPLLPAVSGWVTLVTSRRRLDRLPASHLTLKVLGIEDALELLRQQAGSERIDAEQDAATQIVREVGGLPLALSLVAGRIAAADWTVADQLERLVERRAARTLDDGVQRALATSYVVLSPAVKRALRLLAVHPGRAAGAAAVAAMAGEDPATVRRWLDALLAARLIEEPAAGRYSLHDLVQVYAADRAADEDTARERRSAVARVVAHYADVAAEAAGLLDPSLHTYLPAQDGPPVGGLTGHAAATEWLVRERENLVATVLEGCELDDARSSAVRLSRSMTWLLATTGSHREAELVYSRVAEVTDGADRAHALCSLANVLGQLGRYAEVIPCVERGLATARAAADANAEARLLLARGTAALLHLGDTEAALEDLERAHSLATKARNRQLAGMVLITSGNVKQRSGRYTAALDDYREVAELARSVGSDRLTAFSCGAIGEVLHQQGSHEEALEFTLQEYAVIQRHGTSQDIADTLTRLGRIRSALGQYELAHGLHEEALGIVVETGLRDKQLEVLNDLGPVLRRLGRAAESLDVCRQALAIGEEMQNPYEQARAHAGLAALSEADDSRADAIRHWERAYELYSTVGATEAAEVRRRLDGLSQV
ncbi:tetratricopeptide repeat protein [Kribbella shirazensis]|uniref:Tetratricopeptide (TPR) repeat protein n=1 Tax=Kribbella shirazensis TaxID=1105143 RepID=A0A7X5ZZT3_9ACTN|nr:tetratricopeptide repeat protein [Kribbella shirazensis]NIK56511.1 tetratricopeptide (TPR) repeat protein [Kribbella shirazensis]